MRGIRSWRPALRLALRDAAAHWLRTILSCVLIALPIGALVAWAAVEQTPPPARDQALAGVPADAQALVTATTILPGGAPFPQVPEGAPGPWMGDLEALPASQAALAEILPANDLLPYWRSLDLIATTGIDLDPGQEQHAGMGVADDIDLSTVSTTRLVEAGDRALGILLPALADGHAPDSPDEAVVTTKLAERLGIGVGDAFALVAPPWSGWYSSNGAGRLGEVFQNTQRAYRVSGIVADDAEHVWALDGWMSRHIEADPEGIDGRWVVTGDAPVTWEQAKRLNDLQAFAVSRHVLEHYPAPNELYSVAVDPNTVLTRVVVTILVAMLAAVLVLGLVTPAFAVATDESRRMLGLAAVTGAAPRDLRRTILVQGALIGLTGGLAGAALGIAGAVTLTRLAYPTGDVWARFPWWSVVAGVAIATAIGVVATLAPARTAARLNPVEAVRDRVPARTRRRGGAVRRIVRVALPVVLLGSAAAAAYGAFAVAAIPAQLLTMVAFALAAAGLALCLRLLLQAASRISERMPLVSRIALRDALDHPSRFLPAASVVLITVLAASANLVVTGSQAQNDRDGTGQMVGAGRLALGAMVSVSPDFDRLVLDDAARALAEELPVTGLADIQTTAVRGDTHLWVLPALDRACPDGLVPDAASVLDPAHPVTCTTPEKGFSQMLSVAWMGGSNTYLMEADALRASGLPGAEAAASVLEAGGAIVNDSTLVSRDGQVRLVTSSEFLPTEADADTITTVPGAFLRGFAPPLTVTPETARRLGVDETEYVGAYVLTERALTSAELSRAREIVTTHTSLVQVATAHYLQPWGDDAAFLPLAGLAALAIAATTISLLLARSQARRTASTMNAVGAPPRFLRRVALAQGGLILALGMPLGMLAGLACGVYLVAWYRFARIGGDWLQTVPLWGLQAALAAVVVAASLLAVALVARTPRVLTRRLD